MLGVTITNAYLTSRFEKPRQSVASSAEVDYKDFSEFLGKLAFQMIHKFKPKATSHSSSSSSSSNSSSSSSSNTSALVKSPCILVSITEYMNAKGLRSGDTNYKFVCSEPACRGDIHTISGGKVSMERARTP